MKMIDRLDEYIKTKNLNDNKVTELCGLSKGYLYKVRKRNIDLGNDAKDRILATFLDLNRVWFLTGDGPMLLSQDSKTEENEDKNVKEVKNVDVDKLMARMDELIHTIDTIEKNRAAELQQRYDEIDKTQSLLSRMLSVVENMTASLQHHAPLHCTSLHSDAE